MISFEGLHEPKGSVGTCDEISSVANHSKQNLQKDIHCANCDALLEMSRQVKHIPSAAPTPTHNPNKLVYTLDGKERSRNGKCPTDCLFQVPHKQPTASFIYGGVTAPSTVNTSSLCAGVSDCYQDIRTPGTPHTNEGRALLKQQ